MKKRKGLWKMFTTAKPLKETVVEFKSHEEYKRNIGLASGKLRDNSSHMNKARELFRENRKPLQPRNRKGK